MKCLFPAVANIVGVHSAAGRQHWELQAIQGILRSLALPALAPPVCRVPSFCSEGQCCHPSASPVCSWDPLPKLCRLAFRFGGSPAAREACVQGPAEPLLVLPEGWARGSIPADCPTSCAALSINLMGSLYRQDSWGLIVFPFFN